MGVEKVFFSPDSRQNGLKASFVTKRLQGSGRYDLLLDNVGNRTLLSIRRVLSPNGKCVMDDHAAEISRSNPICFVFIIDQSGSMAHPFGGEGVGRKADFVADVVNRTLHDLVIRATRRCPVSKVLLILRILSILSHDPLGSRARHLT